MESPQDVGAIQKLIESKVIVRLGDSQFQKLKGSDIRYVFELYDELIFGSQIQQRVQSRKAQFKFKASTRRSGDISVCGVYTSKPLIFYIDIAPNILAKRKMCTVSVLTKIVANQAIHIILLCWNLAQDHPTYSSEGLLYQKLLKIYFGTDFIVGKHFISMDLEYPRVYATPFTHSLGLLSYKENSCYIDSLLMLLLFSITDYYRQYILDVRMRNLNYKNINLLTQSNTNVRENIYNDVKDLQRSLQNIYSELRNGKILFSSSVREILFRFYPGLKGPLGWDSYNVSAIYDLLAEIFPGLKIKSIPVYIKRSGKAPKKVVRTLSLLQFWDFISSSVTGEEVDWDNINVPILVFQNGGIPISFYGNMHSEIIDGTIYHKTRSFGETILDGKYELFGVMELHGAGEGVHYTASFCLKGHQWCQYDDRRPSLVFLDEIPEEVFQRSEQRRPELYFYRKAPKSPIWVDVVERPGRKTVIVVRDKGCSNSAKREILKLKPLKPQSDSWMWVCSPHEAQKIYERLEEIKKNSLV